MTEQPDYDLETFVNKAEAGLAQQAKHFSALQGGYSCTGCSWTTAPVQVVAVALRVGISKTPTNPECTTSLPFLPDIIKALRLAMQLEEQASKQLSRKKRP